MSFGADHLGCPTYSTLLLPSVSRGHLHRPIAVKGQWVSKRLCSHSRHHACQIQQKHARLKSQHSHRPNRNARLVSATASSASFDATSDEQSNQIGSDQLQWAQSALASLRRQYKAAIASTRLQAAAFYNPKFFPMVTLCVSFSTSNKAIMRMLHFMFSPGKLPAAQATLLTTAILSGAGSFFYRTLLPFLGSMHWEVLHGFRSSVDNF